MFYNYENTLKIVKFYPLFNRTSNIYQVPKLGTFNKSPL